MKLYTQQFDTRFGQMIVAVDEDGDGLPAPDPASFATRETLWGALTARRVHIPKGLARDSFGCNSNDPDRDCQSRSRRHGG